MSLSVLLSCKRFDKFFCDANDFALLTCFIEFKGNLSGQAALRFPTVSGVSVEGGGGIALPSDT